MVALQDPIGEAYQRARDAWVDALMERKWLIWFFQRADFGPADGDVRQMLQDQYEKETGLTIPKNYRMEDE